MRCNCLYRIAIKAEIDREDARMRYERPQRYLGMVINDSSGSEMFPVSRARLNLLWLL